MPAQSMVPAGNYEVKKRFRHLEDQRKRKDMPWHKNVLDLEHHKLFARTAKGWGRIIFFYLLLYLLITFILITVIFFFYQLHFKGKSEPMYTKPGPGFSRFPRNAMIKFHIAIPEETYDYADEIDNLLEKFGPEVPQKFQDCNKDKLWGYRTKTPCVFIKFNKMIGFHAKTYDDIASLPKKRPRALKDMIKKYPGGGKIWVTCESDKAVKFNFMPHPFFDRSKYMNDLDRLIAVQMKNIPHEKKIHVTCKMWAKNIEINDQIDGTGNIKFYMTMFV
ncbi:sodium/potassium-transporting ATPase subunit beta-like [Drosophila hydei]|uniref:Sodium/potassium-transporting ATPase subunit beta-like n=1 Tax=Drosophila hydei TaxID=7224 RepID=A0A6J1M9U8_DROHY|nr:sodium/potassium-transporting ATPase subunit beta-like [Drosophila hydei]